MAYDLLIRNGLVVDGTGSAGYHGDIAIAGGKIARSARSPTARAPSSTPRLRGGAGLHRSPYHYDAQICWVAPRRRPPGTASPAW